MAPLIALAAVLAALVQRWRCSCGPAATAEAIALLGATSLATVGLLSTAIAVLGWFSGPSFSIIAIALAVLIWPWGQPPLARPAPPPRRARLLRAAGLVVLLAGAAALRWPPIPADLGDSLREVSDPELRACLEELARGLAGSESMPVVTTIPVVGKIGGGKRR